MADQGARPPVLFRGGTVLTMDDAKTVLTEADVRPLSGQWLNV